MGIDIYLKWDGQSAEEHEAQITGFSIEAGNRGYLRESYGGAFFATDTLLRESFDEACWAEGIPEGEQGMFIVVEGPQYADFDLDRQPYITLDTLEVRLPVALEVAAKRYANYPEGIKSAQDSLTEFVALARQKLSEGKRVWVYNSY